MKMILYHGGNQIIQVPEIRDPERTLDFGKGFYTTSSFEQAKRLVQLEFLEYQTNLIIKP